MYYVVECMALYPQHMHRIRFIISSVYILCSLKVARLDRAKDWLHQWPFDLVHPSFLYRSERHGSVVWYSSLLITGVFVPGSLQVSIVDRDGHVSPV